MREILTIRLPSGAPADALEASVVDFCLADPDNLAGLRVQRDLLSSVLDQAGHRRIVLLVPASDIRLATVNVPARQAAKVLMAAPFQLEDQLAEDIETLHFALGSRQADGSHPVAVVTRALMDQWLAPVFARGLRPEAVYPEMLALPWDAEQKQWSAVCETEQVVVRSAPYGGFVCAPEDLVSYLELADPERERPLRLMTLGGTGIDYSRIDWPLELLPGHGSALEVYVRHLQPLQNINLLQAGYSQRQSYERYWRPWLQAAILAGACVLLGAITYAAHTVKLSREIAAQDAANLARFQQLFPAETRIVDLQAQLDQQLRALKGSGNSGGAFPLMEILAQALGANQGLSVQNLQYRDGALFLALKAKDLQVVERLRTWFGTQRGTALDVQSADAGADGVQVRLKLSAI